jgi:hypothetical protein
MSELEHEIGRELLFSDLKPRTIVVIKPPDRLGREIYMTWWVHSVSPGVVIFHSAVKHWSVVNFQGRDDTVIDDQGRKVTVFEYLGEP